MKILNDAPRLATVSNPERQMPVETIRDGNAVIDELTRRLRWGAPQSGKQAARKI